MIVNHNADDALIFNVGGYLPAATVEAERRGNVSLIRQRRKQFIGVEHLPVAGNSISLSYGPVISVSAVKYLDSSDAEQTYPTSSYRYSNGEIYFKLDPPTLADGPNTIWVEYEAGYGDTPTAVDPLWQNIVMMLAYRKYELRGESPGNAPDAWERLMDKLIITAGGDRRA